MTAPSANAFISALIRERLLADVPATWKEVVRTYEDDLNYLSLSLTCERAALNAVLNIEYGLQDGHERRHAAVLVARWRRGERMLGPIEQVQMDGGACTTDAFVARLKGYLELEQTEDDVVDAAA